jgi:hypothetical protein
MTFGDKTKKETTSNIEAKAHISFILEGDGVDKIDWYQVFKNQLDDDIQFIIVHGDVKIYYTKVYE